MEEIRGSLRDADDILLAHKKKGKASKEVENKSRAERFTFFQPKTAAVAKARSFPPEEPPP